MALVGFESDCCILCHLAFCVWLLLLNTMMHFTLFACPEFLPFSVPWGKLCKAADKEWGWTVLCTCWPLLPRMTLQSYFSGFNNSAGRGMVHKPFHNCLLLAGLPKWFSAQVMTIEDVKMERANFKEFVRIPLHKKTKPVQEMRNLCLYSSK